MARSLVLLSSVLAASSVVLFATAASAQTAPATAPATADGAGNDHDGVVGHFAVGYFGISQLPVGGNGSSAFVNAPVIGARYWLSPKLGIDAGIGFGYQSISAEGNTWGLAVHAGLPLALATSHHFTFELTPEATLGFSGGSTEAAAGAPSVSLSGFRLDLGAKIGCELQFGFIGIPQLSLQANVGVYLQQEAWGEGAAASITQTTLSTSVGSDPWAIFTDTVSALYYF